MEQIRQFSMVHSISFLKRNFLTELDSTPIIFYFRIKKKMMNKKSVILFLK